MTGNTSTVATLNRYAFFPNIRGCTASFVTLKGRDALNPTEDHSTGALYIQLDGACQGGATWAVKGSYLSASDRPSVWVVVDGTGALVALWESEDPISVGDTVSPVTADDPTHRAIKIGVPSLAVITALAADLPSAQQADLIAQLDGYAAGERGWLTSLAALADLATIEPRYEPSGRQWAMRLLAAVQDLAVTELYRTALRVDPLTDTWVVAPQ